MMGRRIDAAAARDVRPDGSFVQLGKRSNDVTQPESPPAIRQTSSRVENPGVNSSHIDSIHV